MKTPIIKICNVRHNSEVDALASQGIELAGFRLVEADVGSKFASTLPKLIRYAKSKDLLTAITTTITDIDVISENLSSLAIEYLNFHFSPSQQLIDLARERFSQTLLSGLLSYEDILDQEYPDIYDNLDYTIFDWGAGGTGVFPGTEIFKKFRSSRISGKVIIAGGLNSVNVGRLLEVVSPHALDLDSSVRDPITRLIDEARVEKFAHAVRRSGEFGRQNAANLDSAVPFPQVNQWPWSLASEQMIVEGDIVANARLISAVDDADRYRNAVDSVNQRIFNSLSALARHPDVQHNWLDAALIAFSSTLYFPREMLISSLRYLHMHVSQHLSELDVGPNDFHLFSNDPGALHEDFFRINELHGRLDQDKHARIKGVEDLGNAVSDLNHPIEGKRESARNQLRMISSRPVWVLLADQSLSGHSLIGDVSKVLWLHERYKAIDPSPRRLVVLCQVITKAAKQALLSNSEIKKAVRQKELFIDAAIVLEEEYSVLSQNSVQITDKRVRSDLKQLCEWFSSEYVEQDPGLDRMRRKSGDNLEFGYRRAALLITRQENCPTDSLPLLWYSGTGKSGLTYKGPFPRVHSRIDEQKSENTTSLWEEIETSPEVPESLATSLDIANE